MFCDFIYNFFNNSTVAAILAVLIASYFAIKQYKKQKDLDRQYEIKKDLIQNVVLLKEKIHAVLLIINRIAYSHNITDKTDVDFFHEILKKHEIPRLSNKINEEIPFAIETVLIKIKLYFGKNEKIKKIYEEFKTVLKQWHDPIVKMQISLRIKVDEQKSLSLNNIDNKIEKLIDLIWKEKIK